MDCAVETLAALLAVPSFTKLTVQKLVAGCLSLGVQPEELWQNSRRWKNSKFAFSEEQRASWNLFRQRWSLQGYAEYLDQLEVKVIGQRDFPLLLREAPDAPLLLFLQGNSICLKPPHVAVVGSRTPTRYGQWATQKIVAGLVARDVAIVSGFMVGIDYQSHQVAVKAGGRSVGVLGFGFGQMYPAHLKRAAADFLEKGNLFVTEYPPQTEPRPWQFAARNNIVAGLSAATVIVEAKAKSGSLITAQCALDAGRVVGAVPGPIDSVYSQGTHQLLKQGAVLICSGDDVWQEITDAATDPSNKM